MKNYDKLFDMPLWQLNIYCHYYRLLIVWEGARNKLFDPMKYLFCYTLALSSPLQQVSIILSLYTWFRYVDNVIDGDIVLEENTLDYIAQKEKLLDSESGLMEKNLRPEDVLYVHAMHNSSLQKLNLKKYVHMLFGAMASEHRRRTGKVLVTEEQLDREAMAISEGVGQILVRCFTKEKEPIYDGNGTGQWSDWFIDMMKDLESGIVNIPLEVAERARLSFEDLSRIASWEEFLSHQELREWFIRKTDIIEKTWLKTLQMDSSEYYGLPKIHVWIGKLKGKIYLRGIRNLQAKI